MIEQSANRNKKDEHSFAETGEMNSSASSLVWTSVKLLTAAALCWSAFRMETSSKTAVTEPQKSQNSNSSGPSSHRRLMEEVGGVPSYMEPLMENLREREKLFEDTPPEEIKYWFEYTGELQKYFYRFSRSRGKADYFEGRDDSGVVSARFVEEAGGTEEYQAFFAEEDVAETEKSAHLRLLENCLAMGSPNRPDTSKGTVWNSWFGSSPNLSGGQDRCRILFTLNTVGAGRGSTMLWETAPPKVHAEGPPVWTSEQETAATHLERNLQEIDAMCASGLIAARVQVLVCEPIPAQWTEWMDSKLTNCGGKPWALDRKVGQHTFKVEERPSPVQVVVSASSSTADTCHDLKSGFMEKRMQDLIFAQSTDNNSDPSVKATHPDLVSSDDHDLYVAFKWSSLVTIRAVNAFLQASADIAAAASSGIKPDDADETSSPFFIPSFVRVSYVSEENSKVAKWRMHGDFFHPAAWEISKDSFGMTWFPHSLSGPGGVTNLCRDAPAGSVARKLAANAEHDCGQWWVYFKELQMPYSPEVYANEATPAPVQGGSNFIWMVTERQRLELVKSMACRADKSSNKECAEPPQAVIPLGDLESFLINFTPNTGLGKLHLNSRRPGYSRQEEREQERELVKQRKQLKDQEDIEKALFDYTIYPAALFHKDATIKAARARDRALTSDETSSYGPHTCKSSYYDVTITKPRPALLGWCQAIARRGLCTLYADYFRLGNDDRCLESCGMKKDWTAV